MWCLKNAFDEGFVTNVGKIYVSRVKMGIPISRWPTPPHYASKLITSSDDIEDVVKERLHVTMTRHVLLYFLFVPF